MGTFYLSYGSPQRVAIIGKSGENPALARNRERGRKPQSSHCLGHSRSGKAR